MSNAPSDQNFASPWNQPGGLEAIHNWIRTALAAQNIPITGEMEQIHNRPWSTIVRIPTGETNLFFKATAGYAAHEIPLCAYLSTLATSATPQLIALRPDQPWLIMRDGGQRLREILIAQPDWSHWQILLPHFAALQIAAAQRDELLALGLPDRSLENLPRLYADLIAHSDLYQPDAENGLSDADYQRLHDLIPLVTQKAQQMAAYAVPQSVNHGDLHDANIFYNHGQYAFYDWGDSSFSHPFFSLRTAYVSAETRFDLEENAPELDRLRDAYLPAWREFETDANLHTLFGLAQELWAITSSLTWYQAINALDSDSRKDYAHVLPSLAQELMSLIKT